MMNKKLILLILLLAFPYNIFALHIVTTITPIASLVKMLTKEQATVSSILTQNICPHHYQASFADLNKIKNADLAIYIDKDFDSFAYKLMNNHTNSIKISNFDNINLIKNNNNVNWHLWLNLENTIQLLQHLSLIIIKHSPQLKNDIEANLKTSLAKIEELASLKKIALDKVDKIVIATDSLEYFFSNEKINLDKIYQYDSRSPKYFNLLKLLEKEQFKKCILIDREQNSKLYEKFHLSYVVVDSENWEESGNLEELFYNKYLEIINLISTNCNNK